MYHRNKKNTCRELEMDIFEGEFNKYDGQRHESIKSIAEKLYIKYKTKLLLLHEAFQLESIDPEFHIALDFKFDISRELYALDARVPIIIDKQIGHLVEHLRQYSDNFVTKVGKLDSTRRQTFTIICNQLTAAIIDEYENPYNRIRTFYAEAAVYRPLKVIPNADFIENHTLKYAEHYIEDYTRQFTDLVKRLQLTFHSEFRGTIASMTQTFEHEKAKQLKKLSTFNDRKRVHLAEFVVNLNAFAKEHFLTINKVREALLVLKRNFMHLNTFLVSLSPM